MDHVGGARTYVARGATVLVAAPNAEHARRMFAAPHRLQPDALARNVRAAEVVEVADRTVVGSGARALELIRIDNPHAEGMLIGWVPQAKLGFVADLWSPVRDKLGDKATPGQAALAAAVRKAGIAPERFAGGHGGASEWAPVAALVAKGP
jgi:glyoxylase-like metal-dependent hydrolase (beta-lactamase superfamily II)